MIGCGPDVAYEAIKNRGKLHNDNLFLPMALPLRGCMTNKTTHPQFKKDVAIVFLSPQIRQ